MRSKTLKWIILITTVVSFLLVAAQLFWLNRIYNLEQKEFSNSIIKSVQGVYEDLNLTTSHSTELQKLIEQPDPNSFLLRIDSVPAKEMLVQCLVENLEGFQVFAGCKVALYIPGNMQPKFEAYLPEAGNKKGDYENYEMPSFLREYPFIEIYFPQRSQYILNSMAWWIASGVIVMIVLVALGLCIFYLYKQKFLNEVQKDFIQNVTHEFQTPLTTLSIGLDALEKHGMVPGRHEKFETYINLMRLQTNYLKQHIQNLMKVLKAEASGLVMEKSSVVINDLIKRAMTQMQPFVDEKKAQIALQLDEINCAVHCDEGSLYMVIINLLSNALKYSPQPIVTFRTQIFNNHYRITITDNGIGVNDQEKRKIFKKFYRVPSGDIHNTKGLGLGLYFVKKIIEGHNGSVAIKSNAGTGSEFIIDLPLT